MPGASPGGGIGRPSTNRELLAHDATNGAHPSTVAAVTPGTVVIAADALQLANAEWQTELTLINTVPSAIAELLRLKGIPESVRVVNLAGEPLPQALVQQLYEQKTIERVYDLYGP